jgi:hypothetical protein
MGLDTARARLMSASFDRRSKDDAVAAQGLSLKVHLGEAVDFCPILWAPETQIKPLFI